MAHASVSFVIVASFHSYLFITVDAGICSSHLRGPARAQLAKEVHSAENVEWRISLIRKSCLLSVRRPAIVCGRSPVIYYVIKYGRWRFVAPDTYYILVRVTDSQALH